MGDDRNPHAFPRDLCYRGNNGMTLRDYFAGQALAGLMSNPEQADDSAPDYAYFLADAMLLARTKGGAA